MDWSNEEYVRLYTRDTDDWLLLPWQSRALLPLLLRRMDRSGVVETKRGAKGIAVLVHMPPDVVKTGLDGLLDDGCLVQHERGYVLRNYVEAQTARKSDKLRQKESRDRRRADALASALDNNDVTNRDRSSHAVTCGHGASHESHSVTLSDSDSDSDPASDSVSENTHPARARDPSSPEPGAPAPEPSTAPEYPEASQGQESHEAIVVTLPSPPQDRRRATIRAAWDALLAARTRCVPLVSNPGPGFTADASGPVFEALRARLDERLAGNGGDYADAAAYLVHAVECAAAKVERDRNMLHLVKAFDAEDVKRALATMPDAIRAETPSKLAMGPAAERRRQAEARAGPRQQRPLEEPAPPRRRI